MSESRSGRSGRLVPNTGTWMACPCYIWTCENCTLYSHRWLKDKLGTEQYITGSQTFILSLAGFENLWNSALQVKSLSITWIMFSIKLFLVSWESLRHVALSYLTCKTQEKGWQEIDRWRERERASSCHPRPCGEYF